MKAFDERAETKWNWVDWIAKHPQTDPKRVRLVARVEGQLVGCADALLSGGGVAGFSYIYVDVAYRHQGIGSTLLRAVAGECKQRGATSMFAPMSRRELYEANGFRAKREFVEMTKPMMKPPPSSSIGPAKISPISRPCRSTPGRPHSTHWSFGLKIDYLY